MSNKAHKKMRQLYRRDVRQGARDMGETLGNLMKPKPKWIPWKVWMWGLGIFIKVKKTK